MWEWFVFVFKLLPPPTSETDFRKEGAAERWCVRTGPRRSWHCALSAKPRGLQGSSQWPSQPPALGGGRTARPLLPVLASQPRLQKPTQHHWVTSSALRSPPGPPAAQSRPFRSVLLCDRLRGSLQGRQGGMIFKTNYSQQRKHLESPDHCMLFMLGREGG